MIRFIPQSSLVEGRWRNGQGVSWEIASYKQEGAADFSWRFAKARIDNDVPFSIYPGMDRIFMQLEGNGLDLMFDGGEMLPVHKSNVPHFFSCDVPLNCKLKGGPCVDLNLFTKRGECTASCEVRWLNGNDQLKLQTSQALIYVLDGVALIEGTVLARGDALHLTDTATLSVDGKGLRIFVGHLSLDRTLRL